MTSGAADIQRLVAVCRPLRYKTGVFAATLVVVPFSAQAQVALSVLHNFAAAANGDQSVAPLLLDTTGPSGALRGAYGTAAGAGLHGDGTVFKLTPPDSGSVGWKDKVLWGFTSGTDGAAPESGLVAQTGRITMTTPLYGTATAGGSGNGTVFRLTGTALTTIWTFTGGSDGAFPGGLILSSGNDGALYVYSDFQSGTAGCGSVIELLPPKNGQSAWSETTIWTFTGSDGCQPSGLITDASGVLFGSTIEGGKSNYGTIFKLTPPANGQSAWTEQTIWSFSGGNDGYYAAGLIAGSDGVLYGTTSQGGGNSQIAGTAFKLTPPAAGKVAWAKHTIWRFTGANDGGEPLSALLTDKSGALYGTTYTGGANGFGTAFRLTPPVAGHSDWTENTLWSFSAGSDGGHPEAPLVSDTAGNLYGTNTYGGTKGYGVVFDLKGTGFVPR